MSKDAKYDSFQIEPKWPRKTPAELRGKQSFNPNVVESKWQQCWEKTRIYQPDLKNAKKPYYNLMMFPYPSAEGLHVGNMYAFTGADINGRYKRMAGYDVFEPIGLDGFGIHSENYAIKIGKHPAEQAKISEKNFYRQLHAIGNGFAWENTLETYDPDYYKWTQWIFVAMFKAGLAYRKKSPVNFCPSCKTVLSDEQVIDGSCERCKTIVAKRDMEQWFFRISKYAEKLLQNTYKKDFQWTEKVKIGQRNWIGKKEGIVIKYQISNIKYQIECFTTRPDTNFGATFIVISPEHPFVSLLPKLLKQPKQLKEIQLYVEKSRKKSEADRIAEGRKKTGVFTGFYAVNQLNGYKMPIWISDFALMSVGTGAIVGVPASDMRDYEFASEFKIPIKRVIVGEDGDKKEITKREQVCEEGTIINSEFLNGLKREDAIPKMMDYLEEKGWGKRVTTYKLRDWCISRQRYWGAPIPMIFCPSCAGKGIGWLPNDKSISSVSSIKYQVLSIKKEIRNTENMPGWFPVPDDQLPVLLPADVVDWKPEGTGKGPLAKIASFVETKCPKCGGDADRETDVCDTFLDSSWYHMRYPSVHLSDLSDLGNLPWDPEVTKTWLPVTQYIGGAEHTVLHLLYARFVTMVLKDLGKIDFEEPYTRFYAHGLIIAEGAKMSKSKGNVVVPDAYIAKYGADTLRTYLMFLGPFDSGGDFRDTGIAGMYRFLSRVWRLVIGVILSEAKNPHHDSEFRRDPSSRQKVGTQDDALRRVMHKTIKEVTTDMENFRYNTAIAHIMEYVNELTNNPQLITNNHIKSLLLMLAPFAPHMTEELWQRLRITYQVSSIKYKKNQDKNIHNTKYVIRNTAFQSIHHSPWPIFDPAYLVEDEVTIIVQVSGKLRDTIKVKAQDAKDQKRVEKLALSSSKIQKHISLISPKTPKSTYKTIFVPARLINFVV